MCIWSRSASIRKRIRRKFCAATRRSYAPNQSAGIFLLERNPRFTTFLTKASSLRSPMAVMKPEFRCTAPGWCWWIDMVKFVVITKRPKPTQ